MDKRPEFVDRNDPGHDLGDLIGAGVLAAAPIFAGVLLLHGVGWLIDNSGVQLSEVNLEAWGLVGTGVIGLLALLNRLIIRRGKRVRGGSRPGLRAYAALSEAMSTQYTIFGLWALLRGEDLEDEDDEDDELDIDIFFE